MCALHAYVLTDTCMCPSRSPCSHYRLNTTLGHVGTLYFFKFMATALSGLNVLHSNGLSYTL